MDNLKWTNLLISNFWWFNNPFTQCKKKGSDASYKIIKLEASENPGWRRSGSPLETGQPGGPRTKWTSPVPGSDPDTGLLKNYNGSSLWDPWCPCRFISFIYHWLWGRSQKAGHLKSGKSNVHIKLSVERPKKHRVDLANKAVGLLIPLYRHPYWPHNIDQILHKSCVSLQRGSASSCLRIWCPAASSLPSSRRSRRLLHNLCCPPPILFIFSTKVGTTRFIRSQLYSKWTKVD